MVRRLSYVMRDIFIFDIDGCIMPNIFPLINVTRKNNDSLDQEMVSKASDISLFPEFIEFYKRNCVKSLKVYFITGRKQKYYGKITESQLKPLKVYKDYIIKHFPDNKPHILKEYLNWKSKTIKEIINQWSHGSIQFHIYDDLEDLFPIISKEISLDLRDLSCKLIQEQNDWIHDLYTE